MDENLIHKGLSPAKMFDIHLRMKGITSAWVAESLGITQSYISQIRKEKTPLSKKLREKMNELLETTY